ncbi:MAG: amidohydrolase, partial [Oxalobacteraceae bacterium]
MQQDIFADRLFTGRDILRNVVLRSNDGKIVSIDAGDQPQSGPRRFILPALVNAHDHARPTASSFGTLN